MIFLIIAMFALFAFSAWHTLILLHTFQQEEYGARAFIKTSCRSGFGIGRMFKNPLVHAKKPLIMTARAARIYWLCLALIALVLIASIFYPPAFFLLVLEPFALIASNALLFPYESAAQRKYWNEAHNKLMELKPVVIGITGSYGKTSIKHILGNILSRAAPTLITQGSINTQMGVSRVIRQQLLTRHKYFVVEMGAYGVGSIKGLCDLAPPDYGIVSTVGAAHLSRFGALNTTALAKSELALAAAQKTVIPKELLAYKPFKALKDKLIICPDYKATQTKDGIVVEIDGHDISAPLYGLHHGQNIALSYALAVELGMPKDLICQSLKTCPQISHRLEVTKYHTGATLIDDAYNANPVGMKSAIDLLDFLSDGGSKRRILVTPGIVELGAEHDKTHKEMGEYAANKVDIVIAITPNRIRAFIDGFNGARGSELLEMSRFADAKAWLDDNTNEGDIVLIENDLPDIYEG